MAVKSPQAGSTLLADRRLPVQPTQRLLPGRRPRQRSAGIAFPGHRQVRFSPSQRETLPRRSPPAPQGGFMVEVPITIACGNYDRTAAIRDGRVKVDGCAVTYLPLYPEEIFHRAFKF